MDGAQELGMLIRESRLKQGMSLGQLASAVGRSSSSVRRWERGEVAPAIGIVPRLARVLDLEESSLSDLRPSQVELGDGESEQLELGGRHTTIEDAAVKVPVADTPPMSPAPDLADAAPSRGIVADLKMAVFGQKDSWIGWARGIFTTVVLMAMLFVLVWALGELAAALGEIWNSFETG
jgi:transcriptional regulator with XRE-family HTH domain